MRLLCINSQNLLRQAARRAARGIAAAAASAAVSPGTLASQPARMQSVTRSPSSTPQPMVSQQPAKEEKPALQSEFDDSLAAAVAAAEDAGMICITSSPTASFSRVNSCASNAGLSNPGTGANNLMATASDLMTASVSRTNTGDGISQTNIGNATGAGISRTNTGVSTTDLGFETSMIYLPDEIHIQSTAADGSLVANPNQKVAPLLLPGHEQLQDQRAQLDPYGDGVEVSTSNGLVPMDSTHLQNGHCLVGSRVRSTQLLLDLEVQMIANALGPLRLLRVSDFEVSHNCWHCPFPLSFFSRPFLAILFV